MSKPWLFVGAKVAAVETRHHHGRPTRPQIVAGQIYTVTIVVEHPASLCVALAEIPIPPDHIPVGFDGYDGPRRYFWAIHRFRPVSTIDTTPQVEALKKLVRNTVSRSPAMEGVRG